MIFLKWKQLIFIFEWNYYRFDLFTWMCNTEMTLFHSHMKHDTKIQSWRKLNSTLKLQSSFWFELEFHDSLWKFLSIAINKVMYSTLTLHFVYRIYQRTLFNFNYSNAKQKQDWSQSTFIPLFYTPYNVTFITWKAYIFI